VSDQGGVRSQDIYARVLAAFQKQEEPGGRPLVDRDGTHLATVLELVNVHGGRSWLEPGPNGGSTISVLLPLAANGADDKSA
jgi:signal transduction histidine kinase